MTVKTLVKGFVTGAAAAAVVAAAAGGVTSVATTASGAPTIQPVVWDIPMPQAPAPELQAPLQQTINALGSGGPFESKTPYLEELGRGFGTFAKRGYNDAVSKGYFPLTATVDPNVDFNGVTATAIVTATSANGATSAPTPLTFIQGPSPTGWLLTKGSLTALSAALG